MAVLTLFLAFASAAAAGKNGPFIGVITDTMCGRDHSMMGNTPAPKCTVACVKSNPKDIQYALVEGKNVYVLSDQKAPEKFAGQKVKVAGTLDAKTKTIHVRSMEPAP